MPMALGAEWRSFFDAVLVSSGKPEFFTTPQAGGVQVTEASPRGGVSRMALLEDADETRGLPPVYQGGTSRELVRRLCQHKGLAPGCILPEVCYVGDHLVSDVAAAKQQARWKTVAVIEELEGFEEVVAGPMSIPCGGYLTTPQKVPSYWARAAHDSADITVADVEDLCTSHGWDPTDDEQPQ